MGETTEISWTDHTFNPWIGCTEVSPACDGCYARTMMQDRYGRAEWGAGNERVRTSEANWKQPLRWHKAVPPGETRFVFCASLADVFDNEVPVSWRYDLFQLIEATPSLTWLLLTKRVGNVLKMTDPLNGAPPIPRNAAIGATMANQEEYDRDRMKLWRVKQERNPAFSFGSFEPLLGRIILDRHAPDWIITGGETDQGQHKARPTHPDDFRYMRDQARDLGRWFHHKQNGEWVDAETLPSEIVEDYDVRGLTAAGCVKVGKAKAGRLLDGRVHDDMPRLAA